MRGAFILILLISLLVIGFLVTENVDTFRDGTNGGVEEIDRARDAAGQAEDKAGSLRDSLNRSD